MKIKNVEIQNFRKLKSCRIEFNDKQTLLVGANNSGKTSAMDALILFFKKSRQKEITLTDFTLSTWGDVDAIGEAWLGCSEDQSPDFKIDQWRSLLPTIDIWIEITEEEVHYVSHLIPSLSWTGGVLGVRLVFEPKEVHIESIELLYKSFIKAFSSAKDTRADAEGQGKKTPENLWPKSLVEFLKKGSNLQKFFSVNSYLLDPDKVIVSTGGGAQPQILSEKSIPLGPDPFKGLFKVNIINAHRGFSDSKSLTSSDFGRVSSLSTQLSRYYEDHLDPSEMPDIEDLEALHAIEEAQNKFDEKLKDSFSAPLKELENLGYPGFTDPKIKIATSVDPLSCLSHEAAVQYMVSDSKVGQDSLSLPERYNGLGYQNLVSMAFKLIRFRDEWMRKGKAGMKQEAIDSILEPLHLVLVEEPEAHLHAQVQQVFIKKAYNILRNHTNLQDSVKLSTQMVVSTHSSHIAHEIDFSCLRYFKRNTFGNGDIPYSTVVNLSNIFGTDKKTEMFASRYLKTTHCDLFFADAAILVEGAAEKMLVPYFIKKNYGKLDHLYITLLEINGSHAHRLRPLIESLGLITLIISDIDAVKKEPASQGKKATTEKVLPEKAKDYFSSNSTLTKWLPKLETIDELMEVETKQDNECLTYVVYQVAVP